MKKGILLTVAFAMAGASISIAQPTLDGLTSDSDYVTLGTTANMSYGDWGVRELKGFADATDLYIAITGYPEDNFNNQLIFLGSSDAGGVASGTNLPRVTSGFNPFERWSSAYDFDVSYGFAFNRGGGATDSGLKLVDFTTNPTDKQVGFIHEDIVNFGEYPQDGSVYTTANATYTGIQFASLAATSASDALTSGQGLEIRLPLSSIASTDTSIFSLQTHYISSDGHNYSANVIPEVGTLTNGDTNGDGDENNFPENPIDWTAEAGDQFVTITGGSAVGTWDLY